MEFRWHLQRLSVLLLLVIASSFSVFSANFYAGVVSETDVSQTLISERWMGVSGTVDRGNESLSSFRIGDLTLQDNQTGEVLKADLEGVEGGGFYLGFSPQGTAEPSDFSNISASDLESNGVFSEETFPDFHPNYSQKFDNPSRTFDSWQSLELNGDTFNASKANLSGSADMYLLKYSENSTEYPVFISPIDGLNRRNSFDNCYVSGCNFQALLPTLEGEEFSYSVHLYSKGKAVTGCNPSLEENETAIVLDGVEPSNNCLEVGSPGSYLDFYNSGLEGNAEECGVSVRGEGVTLRGVDLSGFSEAVCLDSGSAEIKGGDLADNEIGISASGNFSASNLSIKESNIALTMQEDSTGNLQNVSIGNTRVYGKARSVSILSYSDTLPNPVGSNQLTSIGSRVRIESTSQDAKVEDLGLGYRDLNLTKTEPRYIYKYDQSGDSFNTTRLEVIVDPNRRYAYYDEEITDFSIFSLYGEEVTGEESGDGSDESGQSGSGAGGGGSGGGSESSGGGAGGGAAIPGIERPEPASLNISLDQKLYNVNKGDTVSLGYEINNTGDVTVGNVTSRLDSEWTSVANSFDALQPGEVSQGTILLTVPEDAPEGNRTIEMEALYQGSALDSEELVMNVSDLLEDSRLEVVESPPFLNLETGTVQSIGVQVENPTNRPIDDLSVEFRGDNECASVRDETYSVQASTARNIQVVLETSNQVDICNDALVFTSDDEIMGFAPMRIEITESGEGPISVPVYVIVLVIWSALLGWRLRNRNSRRRRGFI
jgi:hypothetical protein